MIFKRGSEGPFHWLVKGLQRKCFNIDDKCAYCTGFAAGGEFHFHLLYFFDAIAVVKETWMGLYGTKAKHSFEVFVTLLHLSFLFADIKQSLGGGNLYCTLTNAHQYFWYMSSSGSSKRDEKSIVKSGEGDMFELAHGRYIFGRYTFGCYILDILSLDS